MKVNEKTSKEGGLNKKCAQSNGLSSDFENFKLDYYGCIVIDKRYTSCMLPWIVAEIKRKYEKQTLQVIVGNTIVNGCSTETIIEHNLFSISKCIKLEGKEASTFAYLTKDTKDITRCSCHVFEAETTSKASRFLMTLKTALEECKKQHPPSKEAESAKNDLQMPMQITNIDCTGVQYNVKYTGKLVVTHRKAPPTLIDTSVERFRHHNQQVLSTQIDSLRSDREESKGAKDESGSKVTSFYDKKEDLEAMSRPRSVSDGTAADNNSPATLRRPPEHKRNSSLSESRSLVMHISVNSISFASSLNGNVLMTRKVQEISFCQQGTIESEHFGFICHDAASTRYFCYVFKAESKKAVDNIMKSLKQAFASAWQAVGSTAACENCPLRKLHCLCQSLEGLKAGEQEAIIRQHLFDNLGDSVIDELKQKCQAESKRRDVVEQNEIMMSLLRGLYEEMQKVHRHFSQGQALPTDNSNKEKPQKKFMAKAKRSLGDIFGRSKSRNLKYDCDPVSSSDESETKVPLGKATPPLTQKKITVADMPPPMEKIIEVKQEVKIKRTHRRSYSDVTQVYSKPRNTENKVEQQEYRDSVSDDENFVVEHPENSSFKNKSKSLPRSSTLDRKSSYRRAIFDSVVTPTKLPKASGGLVPSTSPIPENQSEKKTGEQLRALWRKAIMEQRLLIRMEKENSKLRAGEGNAKIKRLKLEYEELLPSNNCCNELWNSILTCDGTEIKDKDELINAVKQGVPKSRRGEVWQFLLKQDVLRNKRPKIQDNTSSYKELREKKSVHQHAILIDCNRTFPAHPYFSQHVGVGQFALLNLLKVYSNVDPELGYCQGLSFVAGLLLMHLAEEEAFDVLRHLNFHYRLRNQYMPDMAGLRVQFYQYSRLLHDLLPDLHDHLEEYEVTPTLYAASWFLTLFASLFPVSFASRMLDLVCLDGLDVIFKVAITLVGRFQKEILSRETFETIVDFLKNDLPKLAAADLEKIVEEALAMNITDQLLRFEVEYQVFQEEEVNPSLIKPLLDKNKKIMEENRNLRNKTNFLKVELKEYKTREKSYLEYIKKLENEIERLKNGSVIASPVEDNTDSFEHIGTEETDDDIDVISCDSPLTIEDCLSEPASPLPQTQDQWTKF